MKCGIILFVFYTPSVAKTCKELYGSLVGLSEACRMRKNRSYRAKIVGKGNGTERFSRILFRIFTCFTTIVDKKVVIIVIFFPAFFFTT